jgi:hypothetical protein
MVGSGRSLVLIAALAANAGAQRVQLELRPRAGDTLRMRLDQTTEMSGSRQGASTKAVVTTMRMFSRAIVESSTPTSAIIVAITDSIDVTSSDEHGRSLARDAQRQLEGRRLRLRLSPDGTVGVADQATTVPREVSEMISVMPASFPRTTVAIGDTWTREMPIPPSPSMGVPLGGIVRAMFRLDSLAESDDIAYVSMRGTMLDAAASAANQPTLVGSVNGSMVVDRKRGWLSESRFLVQLRATIASTSNVNPLPMQFRMKITQHMRVLAKR